MTTSFTVTEEHIKLLRHAVVRWEDCEFGAPAIDCKRPYGNSSVYQDMGEILDEDWDDDGPARQVKDRLNKLHEETMTALQIFLETGKMEAGTYTSTRYGYQWVKVE